VSQPWISGRFRGVYSGDRAPDAAEVRRLPVELESGELDDVQGIEPPPETGAPDELRFSRLRSVKLAPGREGLPHGERTLFDVRIRDWQLLYPAESNKRVYGTLVGTLAARLAPAPVEAVPLPTLPTRPSPAAQAPEPAAASVAEAQDAEEPAAQKPRLEVPELGVDKRDVTTPDQDLARLLGLVVGVLLLAVGLSLAFVCGPASAVLWLSPVCAAIALRYLLARALVDSPLTGWLLGGLCWATQVYVIVGPLETAWHAGCRVPIRGDLLLLGAPVLVAALVRKRLFGWGAAAIWSAILIGWCSQLDGTCARSAPSAFLPDERSAQIGGSALAGAAPGADAPAQGLPREPGAAVAPELGSQPAVRPEQADARALRQTPGAPSRAQKPAPTAERAPDTDIDTEPEGSAARPRGPAGALEGPGGWIAPGDLSPAPGSLRMSLEQANRDPDAFFAATEPRRVYVPTDDIFETGSADLVRDGDLQLARLANLLKLHPERPVVIEIHNDAAAGETQRWLSQRRADAVQAWLVHRGHLSGDQLRFELMGDRQPLVPGDGTYAARRPNRRLELRLADRE